ncbi:SurA N-terminal domain-containing protein [Anaplasma marginale]|uniref:SurA N-terminal domain-containing protein n=1 Tax=Anaplasma marginale TaxID=770 RepID=UPI0012384621|nr:SurA N-terminal domain-containing protein [Anaplasma marginale]KAA8471977.1 hypothetical protein F0Q58_05025 [Anaplasma marginale]KAB0450333.1 hypothetical protein FY210_04975 [Anaplasma marginale]
MLRYLLCCCALCVILASHHCCASSVRIKAVVDGKAITSLDVSRRTKANAFFYKTAHAGSDQGEVLQSLVDESVLELEAKELGISVGKRELEAEASKMFSVLGVCDGLSVGECVAQNGLDYKSVEDHLRSRVIWSKILATRVAPFLAVSDSDVENYVDEAKSAGLETVLDLEQVFVPFKAGNVLDSVLSELNKGVALDKIASRYREHAVYADRAVGVTASAFLPDVKISLVKAKVGQVIGPIRIDRGYLVLKLLNKVKVSKGFLNSSASIKRVSVARSDHENVLRVMKGRGANCDTFDGIAKNMGLDATSLDVRVGDLASKLQFMLSNAELGEVLSSAAAAGGDSSEGEKVDLIVLCGVSQGGSPTAEEVYKIKQAVYTEKLVSASGRLMESIRGRHFTKKF